MYAAHMPARALRKSQHKDECTSSDDHDDTTTTTMALRYGKLCESSSKFAFLMGCIDAEAIKLSSSRKQKQPPVKGHQPSILAMTKYDSSMYVWDAMALRLSAAPWCIREHTADCDEA